jgi:hypothetical protein
MEIFESRTPTETQMRSVRPNGNKCIIFFHHDVLGFIFAGDQIVLDIIDMVMGMKLEEEAKALKESTRLASRALLALRRSRVTNFEDDAGLSARDGAPQAKKVKSERILPVQTFSLLLLNG